MSAAMVVPYIWAVGAELPVMSHAPVEQLQPEMAFYRKYTVAILRRYLKMSMEAGKVPSLIGQEMFRGNVTNYRVGNFDDVVIFLHDVDRCIEKLEIEEQQLIARMSLQEYTAIETAELLGLKPRTVLRRHAEALDRLTEVFLAARMMEPLNCCQGGQM
ncbi:MAG TPA: hypothetical protein VGU46_10920 [Acidobacteriaceae bacterium]|nr:hypothetical protein [Acidobacteriaceae bacterium]